MVETGGFRAKSLMKSHNWFGFRTNSRGFQTGEVRRGYGVYNDIDHTLQDYQAWESLVIANHGLNTEMSFRAWVVTHYATDPAYGRKLAKAINQLEQIQ